MGESKAGGRLYGGVAAEDRRAARRAQLLDAGLELLGRRGSAATTVTAVCQHARLTPRYFYENFENLDELLVAIFDEISSEVAEQAAADLSAARTIEDVIRASISAWINVTRADDRKGRVAFVEALGSDALMRRRLDAMRDFADLLTVHAHGLGRHAHGIPQMAALVVAGGLVEAMIAWVERRIDCTAEQFIEEYTRVCTAAFASV